MNSAGLRARKPSEVHDERKKGKLKTNDGAKAKRPEVFLPPTLINAPPTA